MNWLQQILGLDTQEEKIDAITSLAIKLLDNENQSNDELQSNFE